MKTRVGGLRIAMYSSLFHPIVGGSERQAQHLARALVQRGHSVCVVTQRFPGMAAVDCVEGVPVRRELLAVGHGALYGFLYFISSLWSLIRQGRRSQIIHVHHIYVDAFAAALVTRILRMPVIAKVACGGSVGDMARLERTPFSSLVFSMARRLDRIVAISTQIHEELIAHGFEPARIVRIPNAVDTDWFRPVRQRDAAKRSLGLTGKLVSFAGRLDPQKGLRCLLEAWVRISTMLPDATLLLLGKGPQEGELRITADRLGILDRVVFLGEQKDVRLCFGASEVFTLPSVAEGMSNVLLEAMAMGLPCVASRVGGNVDLIADGVNGLLVDTGDAGQLAEAILRLLRDPAWASRLGVAARETVEHEYSLDRVTDQYVRLYRELLNHHGP